MISDFPLSFAVGGGNSTHPLQDGAFCAIVLDAASIRTEDGGRNNMGIRWSVDAKNVGVWRICLAVTAIYTACWMYPALTEWIGRAVYGKWRGFPNLDSYGPVDRTALFILKHHMWLLVGMAAVNLLAVGVCWQGYRGRSIAVPAVLYIACAVALGMTALFSDARAYVTGVNSRDEAFLLTIMWLWISAPVWLLAAGIRAPHSEPQ